ncbi:class III cytochrome C family protein [Leptothrix ochracea L12]|uniref:Class III cytochrome C family protein n=1 Tax=Leptothrix ochracea L12 TaxID=735332 RepID=I4Z6A3_9BURK|nr:class III cytochrome C family protein [Leptothrix ochracea L12]
MKVRLWWSSRGLQCWAAWWFALFLALVALPSAAVPGLESVLSPGKLVNAHVKWESDCARCHVKFDRTAQDQRCVDCHKEIAQDVVNKTGYHGRMKPQMCRSCHTDHKGRTAQIVSLDKKSFDHTKTDFQLFGKHVKVTCDKCHDASKKWAQAANTCVGCHRKEDVHKGSLGLKCADCHNEKSWKDTDFDHGETKFPLLGKHVDVKCATCHKDARYKETPKACVACHRKDDDQKGHKGFFGDKCESCHGAKSWKTIAFNHDVDTKYALEGKHRTTGCKDCHTGPLYKAKLAVDCLSCHKKDDKHKTMLGPKCDGCHTPQNWKTLASKAVVGGARSAEGRVFDHSTSSFPLQGGHVDLECKDCHKTLLYKDAPKDCWGCHKADDDKSHKGTLGKACVNCHTERVWKNTLGRFDHDKLKFPLRNAHANPKISLVVDGSVARTGCKACHANPSSLRNTPTDCYSCHKKDDKHEGTLNTRCDSCHSDKSWKVAAFDHNRTRFPLTGLHVLGGARNVTCKGCHTTLRYRDAPQECVACHKKDDRHKLKFGVRCEDCHNVRSWDLWSFDHDRRTSYKLEGGHRVKATCETCHRRPAPANRATDPVGTVCVSCHRNDDRHDGQFGARCDQCHGVDNWAKVIQPGSRKGASQAFHQLDRGPSGRRSTDAGAVSRSYAFETGGMK